MHILPHQHVDHFNIRTCLGVVGVFGIITIISYFNELSKAGLLFHPAKVAGPNSSSQFNRYVRETDGSTLLQKGRSEHFDLDLSEIRDVISNSSKRNHGNHGNHGNQTPLNGAIKLSVRLDQNSSYEAHSNASFRLYSYRNSLRNVYLTLPHPSMDQSIESTYSDHLQTYKNSSIVLLYQHEPTGYSMRDCLIDSANQKGLITSNLPINAKFRKDWEKLSHSQKNKFQVLYGSLSFGACEGLGHSCSYLTMLSHPVDRILTVYHLCQLNASLPFCHFTKMNISDMNVHSFARSQGSSLFLKLLYYSRHCKLVGHDEVCLEDSKVTFVATPSEREVYLESILAHIEQWFSVIGLTDHLQQSLRLFDTVYNLNLAGCNNFQHSKIGAINGVPYAKMRARLLSDSKVRKSLAADLMIYDKLEETFFKQLKMYNIMINETAPVVHLSRKKKKKSGKPKHADGTIAIRKHLKKHASAEVKVKPETHALDMSEDFELKRNNSFGQLVPKHNTEKGRKKKRILTDLKRDKPIKLKT